MDKRFTVKDLILFLLIALVAFLLGVTVWQYDIHRKTLAKIVDNQGEQTRDIARLQRAVSGGSSQGVDMAALARLLQGRSTTMPVEIGADAFTRLRATQKMPGYAPGDWLVDSFGNSVGILTALISTDAYGSAVQDQVLESLATRDPATLEWVGLLAKAWTISPDGLTIRFEMQPNAVFSDGEPVTSADVVFTFNWIMNPKVQCPRDRAYFEKIKSVTADGPHAVVFQFREPYFESFNLAAGMNILPEHFIKRFAPEEYNKNPGILMGSGPYRLASPVGWKPGDAIEVLRNDRYWGEPPAMDRIVWRIVMEDTARLVMFRNRETDIFPAQPEQYRDMVADKELMKRVHRFEYDTIAQGYGYIAWNQARQGKATRFADKRVRQAMTLLVDRERICRDIYLGYAKVASGPFNPLSKQNAPDVQPWPFDVERAAKLLADCGYRDTNDDGVLESPDGVRFRFELTYPSGSGIYDRMVKIVKDNYAKAGIQMDLNPMDWAVLTKKLDQRDFDAISLGWTGGIENDIHQMFHSSQIDSGGDNFMSYRNADLDKAIEQARGTVDEAVRLPLWNKAHRILHEDQPYTFLVVRKSLLFLDGRLTNVQKVRLGLNPRAEWYVPKGSRRWVKD